MKKIMMLANNSGGLYIFRRHLMEAFLQQGIEVDAYTPFSSRTEEMKEMGVHLVETPMDRRGMNPLHDFSLFRLYFRAMKKEKPDYVITYTIKPGIYGGLAARLLRIPYAINITGVGTAFQKEGLLKTVARNMYRTAARKAKVIFFENESDAQFFIGERIATEEQTVVLHGAGVDLEHFTLLGYPKEKEPFNFLFVGRVMKEKGADELFEAMRRLHAEDRERIEQYQEAGWLEFAGFTLDVRPFIERAHCGILPSWHEGMSNTNLECAACGRPLITSDIPGCREAVIDQVTGILCKPKDTDSLYNAMKSMMALPDSSREQMGREGRKHMENIFDKRAVVEETIRHINI